MLKQKAFVVCGDCWEVLGGCQDNQRTEIRYDEEGENGLGSPATHPPPTRIDLKAGRPEHWRQQRKRQLTKKADLAQNHCLETQSLASPSPRAQGGPSGEFCAPTEQRPWGH